MAAFEQDDVALFLLSVSETPNFYSGFLPSLFTIATFTGDDEAKAEHTKRWIRRGEIQATGMSITVGVATSILAKSPMPIFGIAIMCAYLLWQYERALSGGIEGGLHLTMDGQ